MSSEPQVSGPPFDVDLFEEISRLNNDLVNKQRELFLKNKRLEQLNVDKNMMLGVVAHDLRNPLSVILGMTELLMDADPEGSAARRLHESIFRSCLFMSRMTEDLLVASNLSLGQLLLKKEAADVRNLIAEAVETNQILCRPKGITLNLEMPSALPHANLDPNKVCQVVNNLIGNAAKFSPNGAEIRIVVRDLGDRFVMEVIDRGPGIPVAEREKLFKGFSTTSVRTTAGEASTGLGLSICKNIVEAHKGCIGVESVEGQGATFRVEIPYDT